MLARRLRKPQAKTAVNKIHDPKTNQPKYEPKEIENIFLKTITRNFTPNLQLQIIVLLTLTLLLIGTKQNEHIKAKITIDKIPKVIGKYKSNKASGGDNTPISV